MADQSESVFACNLTAVDRTVQRLGQVLEELREPGRRNAESEGALASDRIEKALQGFVHNSSEQREKVIGSVDALASMLKGLADGVRTVDRALSGSLPDVVGQPPGPGAPQPPPPTAPSVTSGRGRRA